MEMCFFNKCFTFRKTTYWFQLTKTWRLKLHKKNDKTNGVVTPFDIDLLGFLPRKN